MDAPHSNPTGGSRLRGAVVRSEASELGLFGTETWSCALAARPRSINNVTDRVFAELDRRRVLSRVLFPSAKPCELQVRLRLVATDACDCAQRKPSSCAALGAEGAVAGVVAL